MYSPTCAFCGHPTLLFVCSAKLFMCSVCRRKYELGIHMDLDLFYNPPKTTNKGA